MFRVLGEPLRLAGIGGNILSKLYSLALFFQTPAYVLRLLHVLPAIVSLDRVVVIDVARHGPPPVSAKGYASEVLHYVANNYKKCQAACQHRRRQHWVEVAAADSESEEDSHSEHGGKFVQDVSNSSIKTIIIIFCPNNCLVLLIN